MQFLTLTEFYKTYRAQNLNVLPMQDPRKQFDCGDAKLNEYLQTQATINDKRGVNVTWVYCDSKCSQILGYFTICNASIARHEIPIKHLPTYPIPALLIGRFAIHHSLQGQGIGAMMLMKAYQIVVEVRRNSGLVVLLVEAKNENSQKFYEHFGFQKVISKEIQYPIKLFLPAVEIEKVLNHL